jgi:membrane protein implicated in regulation of membrane protease activity
VDLAVAFLVLAFLAAVAGVLLIWVPAGLIVAGVLFGTAGIGLLKVRS